MPQTQEKLTNLRKKLISSGLNGYLQPVHDEFLSEYPPACYQRVEWLCGFSGSAGMAVVLDDKAALFVDGRYTLQAANQVDGTLFSIHNSGDTTPAQWLARQGGNIRIGYDAALFTPAMLERMAKENEAGNVALVPVGNLVDEIWIDRPAVPATPVFLHEEKYAGETAQSKCERLAVHLKTLQADAALICAPDSVCWLLNLRARDVECTPLLLARALLHANGTVELFVDGKRLPPLPSFVRASPVPDFSSLSGKHVLCDPSQAPASLVDALAQAGVHIIKGSDPCVLPKACKNKIQLAGIRAAHIRDGAAIVKLLYWLDTHRNIESVTEMEVADKLLAFRAEDPLFVEPSFPTIAGSGPNGAIVHYRADEKSNRRLKKGELLLLDSGGQYPDGTTDITRTIAIGTPSAEHKERFTRVLKGHIALAMAVFPKGMKGSQLDVLARQYLWQAGLDYDHGTGHGVGQFLGVHEGPQRISKRAGDAALEVGMILSNEPGYYKTGEYGIRIENLVTVVDKGNGFLGFETITCAPIDIRLIEASMLTVAEHRWLAEYHEWVKQALTPLI